MAHKIGVIQTTKFKIGVSIDMHAAGKRGGRASAYSSFA